MARTVMAEPIAELEAAGLKMDWDDPSSLYANRLWITQCPREFDFEDSHRPAEFRHAGPFHDGGGRPEIAFPWERLTGAPLVYASMGTMLNGDPGVFRTILDAAARLPAAQLVLSVGQALRVGDLGPLPANAVAVNQAPQLPLLERASLTVTHAGLNTVLESLARGVPQVAIPVSYDQPGVAARIAHHGTGLVGSLDGLTAPGLAALVREALDNPSYRKNARQIRNAIRRTDGLSRAAELLEAGLSAPRPATARYEPTDEADAIVVGSGINGLVTAAELAQAGWSVILLERNVEIGGFIATEERTLPGYLHDTFSSWHPLFVSGPAYAGLGKLLHQHGLEYRNADGWVTASVADDGRSTFAHRTPNSQWRSSATLRIELPTWGCCNGWVRTWRQSAACSEARCVRSLRSGI